MKNERNKWKPELKPELKTQVFSTKNYLKVARHQNQKNSVVKAGNGIGLGRQALVIIFLSFMFTAFIFVSSFSTPVFATSNPGHPASQVDPGTFPAGNFSFQGNVGIGTTAPSQKLEVNGNLLVNSTSYPQAFFVNTSSGKVGIGTTSPNQLLTISGNWAGTKIYDYGSSAALIELYHAGGTATSPSDVADGHILSYFTSNGYFNGSFREAASIDVLVEGTPGSNIVPAAIRFMTTSVSTGYREVAKITSAGNVGIGTTAPGGTLPTSFTAGSDGKILEIRAGSTANDQGIFIRRSDGAVGLDLWSDSNSGPVYIDSRWENGAGDIIFRTETSSSPRMVMVLDGDGDIGMGGTITNNNNYAGASMTIKSGNVGIGTTTPISRLDVSQGTTTSTNINHNDTDNKFLSTTTVLNVTSASGFPSAGTLIIDSEAMIYSGVSGNTSFTGLTRGALGTTAANHTNNTAVYFLTTTVSKNSTTTPQMVVRSDGKVGIGTTTPQNKLDVAGNITASSVIVNITATNRMGMCWNGTHTVIGNLSGISCLNNG